MHLYSALLNSTCNNLHFGFVVLWNHVYVTFFFKWIADISNLQLSNDQHLYASVKFDPEPHVFTQLNPTSGTQGHRRWRAVGAGRHVQCVFHSSASPSLFVKVYLLLIGRNDERSGSVE